MATRANQTQFQVAPRRLDILYIYYDIQDILQLCQVVCFYQKVLNQFINQPEIRWHLPHTKTVSYSVSSVLDTLWIYIYKSHLEIVKQPKYMSQHVSNINIMPTYQHPLRLRCIIIDYVLNHPYFIEISNGINGYYAVGMLSYSWLLRTDRCDPDLQNINQLHKC